MATESFGNQGSSATSRIFGYSQTVAHGQLWKLTRLSLQPAFNDIRSVLCLPDFEHFVVTAFGLYYLAGFGVFVDLQLAFFPGPGTAPGKAALVLGCGSSMDMRLRRFTPYSAISARSLSSNSISHCNSLSFLRVSSGFNCSASFASELCIRRSSACSGFFPHVGSHCSRRVNRLLPVTCGCFLRWLAARRAAADYVG